MERILYDTIKIAIEKTKNNVVTIKKDNFERLQRIVKLPYTKISVITGLTGPKGDTGALFVPVVEDGILSWNLQKTVLNNPSSVNLLANINSITNTEIYSIVNN